MTPKPKPPLKLILPQFKIAVAVEKAARTDRFVILPEAEFLALVEAAGKEDR